MTIDDNDGPTLTIGHETVDEAGNAYLEVRLSSPAVQAVSFDWATADGSAKAGKDYEPKSSGSLSFAPGETSKTITVRTTQDNDKEADEDFKVTLSDPANATILTAQDTATIGASD